MLSLAWCGLPCPLQLQVLAFLPSWICCYSIQRECPSLLPLRVQPLPMMQSPAGRLPLLHVPPPPLPPCASLRAPMSLLSSCCTYGIAASRLSFRGQKLGQVLVATTAQCLTN